MKVGDVRDGMVAGEDGDQEGNGDHNLQQQRQLRDQGVDGLDTELTRIGKNTSE